MTIHGKGFGYILVSLGREGDEGERSSARHASPDVGESLAALYSALSSCHTRLRCKSRCVAAAATVHVAVFLRY